MSNPNNASEFKKDVCVYLTIIVLSACILILSHLRLGFLGIALIVFTACTEASILVFYFMHLKTKKKTIHLVLLLTIVFFMNLLFWPAWDIAYSPRTPSEFTSN